MDRLSRDGKYNVTGLATVLVALLLTQVIAGGPWLEVGLAFGAAVAVGLGGGLLLTRRTHRRDPVRAIERAYAQPAAEPRRALPIRVAGEAA